MPAYAELKSIFDRKGTVVLDGAVGTQLQSMGVPMDGMSWAAAGLKDYPFTTQRMHELYIRAGVDVITTNTYSSARHNLEPLGLAEMTAELNLRAVMLAQMARERAAGARKIWIAGAISNFGLTTGSETGFPYQARYQVRFPSRNAITEEAARKSLNEQARILAEAGADFILIEGTGSNTHRGWLLDAARRTGLPFWLGFRVRMHEGKLYIGYRSDTLFADGLEQLLADDIAGINLFHSSINAIEPGLAVLKAKWKGPIGVYPEADRTDYISRSRDESQETPITPDEFVKQAQGWIKSGVQLVGGCCGIDLPYIEKLATAVRR
jgi:homocysteine S-methyltransferase